MIMVLREILGSIKRAMSLVDGVGLIFFPGFFGDAKPKLINQPSNHPVTLVPLALACF
jgi:hypothetical protein